ncbi:hypothetical protein SAMN05444163_3005 [Bradyrhizobium ottawaense]|uniref:Uncharacterized protein n=1 Tax=Bradyrhizobium ottawaense TaxID=931866 RepID=A0ABY0PJ04_9BRAD|nr:hypothetical protein SAMN05444163_3005 [Bradyrhizobium ottawaense]
MAYAPLVGQDGGSRKSDLPDGTSGIFLREGLDSLLVICPSGKFTTKKDRDTAAVLSPKRFCRYSVQTLVVFMPLSASVLVL